MHDKTIVTPSLAIIFPGSPVIGGAKTSLTALIGYLSKPISPMHDVTCRTTETKMIHFSEFYRRKIKKKKGWHG
jgi:hypothetical protein